MNQKGFALLEILVVVVIVALFAGGGLYLKNLTNQQSTLTVGNDAIKQATQEQQQAQAQVNQEQDTINQLGEFATSSQASTSSPRQELLFKR